MQCVSTVVLRLKQEKFKSAVKICDLSCCKIMESWGPFLERPGKLTGPKSYFEIKFSRKVGCVLTPNEVHFVSLGENFTVQI